MGVHQQLDYLKALGVNTIYFNPIFDAGSNHGYDTQDYTRIDPYFGTQKDWENLVKQAERPRHPDHPRRRVQPHVVRQPVLRPLRPLPDGRARASPPTRRTARWFFFRDVAAGNGRACAGTAAAPTRYYDGWFGFDSIPVINKSLAERPGVLPHRRRLASANRWLKAGAGGWRLDVSGDASFPAGYWETFRDEVKATKPDALTISETWQKDSTLLRMIRGDRLDTTMNYRLRDAVLGLPRPRQLRLQGLRGQRPDHQRRPSSSTGCRRSARTTRTRPTTR